MQLSWNKVRAHASTLVSGEKQAQAREPGGSDPEKGADQDIRMNQSHVELAKCLAFSNSTAYCFVLITEESR